MSPIKKSKIYGWAILVYVLIIIAIVNSGCGSRKKELHETEVKKETVKQTETASQVNQSSKTVDSTKTTQTSLREEKNEQKDESEIEADSVVTHEQPDGSKKTTIYVKPGSKIKTTSNKQQQINTQASTTVQANVNTTSKRDSNGKQSAKEQTKQDSSIKDEKVDRKGTGTTFAYTIPITIGVVLIAGILIYFLVNPKK